MTDTGLKDAAQRLSDTIALHITVNGMDAAGKWVAAKIADGTTDGSLYDTRDQAISHQSSPEYYCYINVPASGMPVKEAAAYLKFNRALFDHGMRMPDPNREYVLPQNLESLRGAL